MTETATHSTQATRSDRQPWTWGVFVSLALIWGSSFLFIKIGLDAGMTPLTLVTWRLGVAAALLLVMLRLTGGRFPTGRAPTRRFLTLAFTNVALPLMLIAWGERSISSALASILNGLVPLFVIVIAALVLHDEPITLNRMVGLLAGFGGAVLLASPNLGGGPDVGATAALVGEVAVAVAALSYAVGTVYARHRITGQKLVRDPVVGDRAATAVEIATAQVVWSLLICGALALVFEHPAGGVLALPPDPAAWFAVTWLGALGSGIGYVLFFYLVRSWGATRTSLVTYVMPIVGITLGVVILGEQLHLAEVLGSVLIVGGVILANSSVGRRVLFQRGVPSP